MNEWLHLAELITILVANFSMIAWFRKDSKDDWVRSENTLEAIRVEMKDFHGRLCSIEERRLRRRDK